MRRLGRVGGIGCLVPRSGPNLALFESCGAMDGESCATKKRGKRFNFEGKLDLLYLDKRPDRRDSVIP